MRRKALVTMLELIKPALADKAMVPVFQNFCFTGREVYGSNDALAIVGKCTTPEAFSSHGETLLGILRASRAEELELSFEDAELIIKAGRTKARLPFLPPEEFIFEEPTDEPWQVKFPLTNDIMDTLSVCLMTAANDNSMPALMGVCLNVGDGVSFYSSDSEALTHYLTDMTNDTDATDESFIMPTAFIQAVLRIAGKDKSINGTLKVSADWAFAELENGYRVYGRVIHPTKDGISLDFPAKLEEATAGKEFIWLDIPSGLEHALSRARVVTDGESVKTKITIKDEKMILLSEANMGTVRDTLKIPGHPDVEAHVSAALMARSLAVCNEMMVFSHYTAFRKGEDLFQLLSNRGD